MTIINALNNTATYTVTITCRNMRTFDPCRKEYVTYRSLFAAKEFATKVADCVDVCNVDVMDNTTGEIMWYKSENGEIYEATT